MYHCSHSWCNQIHWLQWKCSFAATAPWNDLHMFSIESTCYSGAFRFDLESDWLPASLMLISLSSLTDWTCVCWSSFLCDCVGLKSKYFSIQPFPFCCSLFLVKTHDRQFLQCALLYVWIAKIKIFVWIIKKKVLFNININI